MDSEMWPHDGTPEFFGALVSIRKRTDRSGSYQVVWREEGAQHSRSFTRKGDALTFEADVKRRLQIGRRLAEQTPAGFLPSVAATTIDEAAVERAMWARPRPTRPLSDRRPPIRPGTTYAIASKPYDGWVKLGRSADDPIARLGQLQCGNPRPLVILAVWPIDAEDWLHQAYDAFRGYGEWFALPMGLLVSMRGLERHKTPHEELLRRWSTERIRRVAGGSPRSPEAYAARFRMIGSRT